MSEACMWHTGVRGPWLFPPPLLQEFSSDETPVEPMLHEPDAWSQMAQVCIKTMIILLFLSIWSSGDIMQVHSKLVASVLATCSEEQVADGCSMLDPGIAS